jgi:conjugative relaxase-like TrwC/TraI family protein
VLATGVLLADAVDVLRRLSPPFFSPHRQISSATTPRRSDRKASKIDAPAPRHTRHTTLDEPEPATDELPAARRHYPVTPKSSTRTEERADNRLVREHDCNPSGLRVPGAAVAWFRRMGADEVDYHRHTVMHRGDHHPGAALAYYGSRGETPLEWGGQLADRLGLVGAVDDAGYEAIPGPGGARDPHLGTRLTATRRPGVELVVAAHKTVAMLGLMGRADDMHAILDAETDATMAFLEEWFARQGGRRGRGQTRTQTGGLLWARTRHATSRAGDPAPHDHVLVANLTEMLDGEGGWKALDTAGLRDLTHAATMVGRVTAAERAVELGYAIEPDPGPTGRLDHWAIAGIPRDVTELFSKRSDEIDAALATAGFTSYQAQGVAARETRRAKRPEAQDSLIVRWLDELDGIGWPARKLSQRFRIVQDRQRQPLRNLSPQQRADMVDALLGPEGPLAERKAFTRADVIRLAAPRLYGYAAGELDRVVDAVTRHPEAIPLVGQPAARSHAWAAASALATEAAVADVAERMAHRQGAPAVPAALIDRALAAKQARLAGPLTAGQITAARAVATSGRGLDLVVGVAGSGKTTVLEAVRSAFETAGYTVVGTATSGQAARTLAAAASILSHTVASLRWRLAHGQITLDARTAVVVDEAGMTDDPDLLAVLASEPSSRATPPACTPWARTSANATPPSAPPSVTSAPATPTPPSTGTSTTAGSTSLPPGTRRSTKRSTAGSPTNTPAPTRCCSPGSAPTSPPSTNAPAPAGRPPAGSTGPRSTSPVAATPPVTASSPSPPTTPPASSPANAAPSPPSTTTGSPPGWTTDAQSG